LHRETRRPRSNAQPTNRIGTTHAVSTARHGSPGRSASRSNQRSVGSPGKSSVTKTLAHLASLRSEGSHPPLSPHGTRNESPSLDTVGSSRELIEAETNGDDRKHTDIARLTLDTRAEVAPKQSTTQSPYPGLDSRPCAERDVSSKRSVHQGNDRDSLKASDLRLRLLEMTRILSSKCAGSCATAPAKSAGNVFMPWSGFIVLPCKSAIRRLQLRPTELL
jgi:hypothetical protein